MPLWNVLKQEFLNNLERDNLIGVTSTSSIILTLAIVILQIVTGLVMLGKMVSYKVTGETKDRVIMALSSILGFAFWTVFY